MKRRNLAKTLMIIGIFIPCVLYPFASAPGLFPDGAFGIKSRISEYEIVIKKGEFIPGSGYGLEPIARGHYEDRIVVPNKYCLTVGITIFFIGLAMYIFRSPRNSNKSKTQQNDASNNLS